MRGPRTTHLLVLVALLVTMPGCAAEAPDDARDGAPGDGRAAERGAPAPDPATVGAGDPWYRRERALDLTGDGRPDSVRLEAVGPRPDSLRVTLTIRVDGEEKLREAWGSGDELALVEPADRRPPRVDTVLRARLDGVLASVAGRPLGAPGMRLVAEDAAALAGIEPRPTHGASFAYGYETTVRLAWDAPRARFVRLWSCC